MLLINVDFPHPDGPINAVTLFFSKFVFTFFSICFVSKYVFNCFTSNILFISYSPIIFCSYLSIITLVAIVMINIMIISIPAVAYVFGRLIPSVASMYK